MRDEGISMTFRNENGEYTIKNFDVILTLDDVMEYLVKPMLHAAGYNHNSIAEYFGEG